MKLKDKKKSRYTFDIPHAFLPIRKILKNNLAKCAIHNVLGILASRRFGFMWHRSDHARIDFRPYQNIRNRNYLEENKGLIRLREDNSLSIEGICGDCIHQFTCLGSCVANNFHRTGKLNAPFYFCQQADEMALFPNARKET